jgi:predicted cytidylate kinase
MLITVSGLPGSGKTTVARLVSRQLGLKHVYAGDIFRKEAERRGLTLEAFGTLAETDHEIDRALDRAMLDVARQGNVVLEGRLAGFMAARAGLDAFKVRLEADEEVRAARIAKREAAPVEDVRRRMQMREESDARRYRAIYDFDYYDRGLYDLVAETDDTTPEDTARQIAEGATAAQQRGGMVPPDRS